MGVQGALVAAHGPLRAAVLGTTARLDGGDAARAAVLVLLLAGVGERPEAIWVVGALAFAIAIASASQDIAIDAYAVEVLRTEEQGAAVGARLAFYRAAMLVSGGAAITLAARIGWPAVNALLALVFVPMLVLTWRSPEPEVQPDAAADAARCRLAAARSACSAATARSRSSRSWCSTSLAISSRSRSRGRS